MKTLHKTLSAILFALLAVTFFAACSSDSDDGSISAGYLANGATWTGIAINGDTVGTLVFKFDRTVTVSLDLSSFEPGLELDGEYTYVIDGSDVYIVIDELEDAFQLTYESGALVFLDTYGGTTYALLTFTK